MLGYLYNATISSTLVTSDSVQANITIQTPGIYAFSFCLNIYTTTSNPTTFYVTFLNNGTLYGYSFINGQNISSAGSFILSCTATGYQLRVSYAGAVGTSTVSAGSYFQAVRIG